MHFFTINNVKREKEKEKCTSLQLISTFLNREGKTRGFWVGFYEKKLGFTRVELPELRTLLITHLMLHIQLIPVVDATCRFCLEDEETA